MKPILHWIIKITKMIVIVWLIYHMIFDLGFMPGQFVREGYSPYICTMKEAEEELLLIGKYSIQIEYDKSDEELDIRPKEAWVQLDAAWDGFMFKTYRRITNYIDCFVLTGTDVRKYYKTWVLCNVTDSTTWQVHVCGGDTSLFSYAFENIPVRRQLIIMRLDPNDSLPWRHRMKRIGIITLQKESYEYSDRHKYFGYRR